MNKHIAIFLFLAFACASLFSAPLHAQRAPKVHGLSLMSWAKKVGDDRYESPRSFSKTYDVFYDRYKRSKRVKVHKVVNLPNVKFGHFESLNPKTTWSGFNVYEYKGKVRIYVIARAGPDASIDADKSSTKK